MQAVIATGTGRYADPWHPFTETSERLAEILEEAGFAVVVDHDVDHAMTTLSDVDLLCVNAGDPWRSAHPRAQPPREAVDGFTGAVERGIGVFALHASMASLRDYPLWAPTVGRMWVPGISFHPPADVATVTGGAFPDGTPVEGFDVFDERYCRLQQIGYSHTVCTHPGEDGPEPTAWVRDLGRTRVAGDLLGHDASSFDSAGHRDLVHQLALWTVVDLQDRRLVISQSQ